MVTNAAQWVWCNANNTWQPLALNASPNALLLGYSVFTTFLWASANELPMPAPNSCWLKLHLLRLQQNATTMGWQFPTIDVVLQNLYQATELLPPPTAKTPYHALRLSAYPEPFTLESVSFKEPLPTALLLSSRGLVAAPSSQALKPSVHLQTVAYTHPLPSIKHGSWAASLHLKRLHCQHNSKEPHTELIWVNQQGQLTEGTSSNVFFIVGTTLITAPEPMVLPGITRRQVLKAAKAMGLVAEQRALELSELPSVQGAFLSNSIKGLQAVAGINQQPLWQNHEALALWQRLYKAWYKLVYKK